ncbi:7753_t:CDS:2 [Entrophospora sp. SA101]|nr:7753_t:CDS:2 [Entrophospora sp. SA101]CAJ0825648.1 2533_t:CDS:2 [Entrophospora sp. SA101]
MSSYYNDRRGGNDDKRWSASSYENYARLYVGRISRSITERDIDDAFAKYGRIRDIDHIHYYTTPSNNNKSYRRSFSRDRSRSPYYRDVYTPPSPRRNSSRSPVRSPRSPLSPPYRSREKNRDDDRYSSSRDNHRYRDSSRSRQHSPKRRSSPSPLTATSSD